MKKKLFIILGIVVVVVVVAGIVVVANLDKVVASKKGEILARAESELGRGVTIDDIKVALWPGIGVSLTGVTLADDPAFSKEPFVHVADLRVNV